MMLEFGDVKIYGFIKDPILERLFFVVSKSV